MGNEQVGNGFVAEGTLSSSGKVPPRPRGAATDPLVDPRLITPVEPLFDEATFIDATDRQPAPDFDDHTTDDDLSEDTTTVGKDLEKSLSRLEGRSSSDAPGEATQAAHRGARRREVEPPPVPAKVNKWSSTVMGQGPPPPTAEEIEAARAAEEAARAKEESQSDAPSTKRRAKFFEPTDAPRMMGRYELIAEIASGGMATVFLARLRGAGGFQRLVAIKRLHPHLQNEEDFIQMFLDEARIAAQIHHAHVVPILEIASSEAEGYYLVMEYIEGITLYDVAAHASAHKITVPREIVLRIVLDTLSGLHAAHELIDADGTHLSVVHRDCTPSNMLVGIDGSTRLTDFGVARAASRLSSTLHGTLKGKVAYMAPEQVRRADYDHRADVFSMGVILWELLTQKRLFRAETKMETLNRVMTAPIPRVGQVGYGIPTSLETATAKALARDPIERFQSAIEMAEALEKAVGTTIASPRQVAEFVQKLFGKSLSERRDAIRKWTDANDGSEPLDLVRRPRLGAERAARRADFRASARRAERRPSRQRARRRCRPRADRTSRWRASSRRTNRPSPRRGRGRSRTTSRRRTSRRRRRRAVLLFRCRRPRCQANASRRHRSSRSSRVRPRRRWSITSSRSTTRRRRVVGGSCRRCRSTASSSRPPSSRA